jgi:quercetin dioxygenase-like cupin family protein
MREIVRAKRVIQHHLIAVNSSASGSLSRSAQAHETPALENSEHQVMRTHPRDRESDFHEKQCSRRDPSLSKPAEEERGATMIRCVRMWTGDDGDSLFEEGWIDLAEGVRDDFVGKAVPVVELSFQETRSGGSFEWHQDPVPRFVITLSGTLEFTTKSGATFTIRPGDVLLAQDNSGTGHQWKLIGDDPWRRAYVVYKSEADLDFKPLTTKEQA